MDSRPLGGNGRATPAALLSPHSGWQKGARQPARRVARVRGSNRSNHWNPVCLIGKAEIKARLAGLSLSPARELEIIDEFSQHLQDRYEQELSRGTTEEEAQRELLEELNAPELLDGELKQVERRGPQNTVVIGTDTTTSNMGDITQDLRY